MEKSTFNYKVIVKHQDFTISEIVGVSMEEVINKTLVLYNTLAQFNSFKFTLKRGYRGCFLKTPLYIDNISIYNSLKRSLEKQYVCFLMNKKFEITIFVKNR